MTARTHRNDRWRTVSLGQLLAFFKEKKNQSPSSRMDSQNPVLYNACVSACLCECLLMCKHIYMVRHVRKGHELRISLSIDVVGISDATERIHLVVNRCQSSCSMVVRSIEPDGEGARETNGLKLARHIASWNRPW